MIWLFPDAPPIQYAKQFLHSDEFPYFVEGTKQQVLQYNNQILIPAICYESLQHEHAAHAANLDANIYMVSVTSCIGPSDDFLSVLVLGNLQHGEMAHCLHNLMNIQKAWLCLTQM